MAESSHTKIFVAVVSSLITAGVLWFAGFLPALWRFTAFLISLFWRWLASSHSFSIYGSVFLVLGVCALIGALIILRELWHLTPLYRSSSTRYTSDIFYGARWTWSYAFGSITGLWCECPHCSTTMVYTEDWDDHGNDRTDFSCETCGNRSHKFEGKKGYAIAKVTRQIERKIKTGEYKKHIK